MLMQWLYRWMMGPLKSPHSSHGRIRHGDCDGAPQILLLETEYYRSNRSITELATVVTVLGSRGEVYSTHTAAYKGEGGGRKRK